MRIVYLLMKILLFQSLRIFYSKRVLVNSPKEFWGSTIYVSNHAAAFMDPLVVAGFAKPSVHFMVRADVFSKYTKSLFWAAQMLPIYRQQDGKGNNKKNELVFEECAKLLSKKRNLLIFGEGFTDDVFIRRLKPIKKGAVRIGFIALERMNWSKKIHLAAIGCNYSDPNRLLSDLVISYSDKICLNDYQKEFESNPNKAITDVTLKLELLMRAQITDNRNAELAPIHEDIMSLTRKGMHPVCSDKGIPLKTRWKYSQRLAHWLNSKERDVSKIETINSQIEQYKTDVEKTGIDEETIYWKKTTKNGSRIKETLTLIILFPITLIGVIHCGIPYNQTKKITEKTMKRKVFWGSVKLFIGEWFIAIFNVILLIIIYNLVDINGWYFVAYFFSIGFWGVVAYFWLRTYKTFKEKGKANKLDLTQVITQRDELMNNLNAFLTKEFR